MTDDGNGKDTNRPKRWIRVLHIYISLYSLLLILFFGVTGFMMNHPEWFGFEQVRTESQVAEIPVQLCKQGDRLEIVEYLRRELGISGLVQSCEIGNQEIRIGFARAGRRVDLAVDRASGKTDIQYETKGLAALLAAIHSGENTGRFGRRVIDLAAVFLVISALTGLVLWSTLTVRRETGIIWLVAGVVIAILIGLRLVL